MTREQAAKRARKLFGPKAYATIGPRLSSPEDRQAALDRRLALRLDVEAIDAEIKRRLADTPWYVELMEKRKAINAERNTLPSGAYYKFRVGFIDNVLGAFNVEGEGDTWEEAFAQAERKRKATA